MKTEVNIKTDLYQSALAMGYRNVDNNTMCKPVAYLRYLINLNDKYFRCDFYKINGEVSTWSSHTFNQDDEKNYIEAICRAEYLEGDFRRDNHSREKEKTAFEFLTIEQQMEASLQ